MGHVQSAATWTIVPVKIVDWELDLTAGEAVIDGGDVRISTILIVYMWLPARRCPLPHRNIGGRPR
jgi:hypothetical protein